MRWPNIPFVIVGTLIVLVALVLIIYVSIKYILPVILIYLGLKMLGWFLNMKVQAPLKINPRHGATRTKRLFDPD